METLAALMLYIAIVSPFRLNRPSAESTEIEPALSQYTGLIMGRLVRTSTTYANRERSLLLRDGFKKVTGH
jgi:hypothetical protein